VLPWWVSGEVAPPLHLPLRLRLCLWWGTPRALAAAPPMCLDDEERVSPRRHPTVDPECRSLEHPAPTRSGRVAIWDDDRERSGTSRGPRRLLDLSAAHRPDDVDTGVSQPGGLER